MRQRLRDRRRSETVEFDRDGSKLRVTVGYFENNAAELESLQTILDSLGRRP